MGMQDAIEKLHEASQKDLGAFKEILDTISQDDLDSAFSSTSAFSFLVSPLKRNDKKMIDLIYKKTASYRTDENPTHEYMTVDIAPYLCKTKNVLTIGNFLDMAMQDILVDRQSDIIERMAYKVAKNIVVEREMLETFSKVLEQKNFTVPQIIDRALKVLASDVVNQR